MVRLIGSWKAFMPDETPRLVDREIRACRGGSWPY